LCERNRSATKTLADVHKDLRQLMTPQTVLVGHSVDSDLKAMKLVHKYIVDTAACYPHPKYASCRR
jgi:RNA exonuclease 1